MCRGGEYVSDLPPDMVLIRAISSAQWALKKKNRKSSQEEVRDKRLLDLIPSDDEVASVEA